MGSKAGAAVSLLSDPSYDDLEDYFEKVIQLNQLEMLYSKHLVDESTYAPLAHRYLSDISSQKDVICVHQQYRDMPKHDVAFFDAFMALFAPDDTGIWAKAKLRITKGIQQQGGTSLVALGGHLTTMKDLCYMATSSPGAYTWSQVCGQLFDLCTAMSSAQSALPQRCRQYNELFLNMRTSLRAKPADGHPTKEDIDPIIQLCQTALEDLSLEGGKH